MRKIKLYTISIFQKIDELGNYTNSDWFLSLNRNSLIKYIKELVDIWYYRAALSPQVRQKISPPNGNPFTGFNINNIDRIEIVKGSTAVLYGSNAIGSVVNIITKEYSKRYENKIGLQV